CNRAGGRMRPAWLGEWYRESGLLGPLRHWPFFSSQPRLSVSVKFQPVPLKKYRSLGFPCSVIEGEKTQTRKTPALSPILNLLVLTSALYLCLRLSVTSSSPWPPISPSAGGYDRVPKTSRPQRHCQLIYTDAISGQLRGGLVSLLPSGGQDWSRDLLPDL